ncbi:MAG: helix-hairpin-helix domain-containing protein [Gemmatimonadota bacterium]|nr:MAG: helix-hairpin-helix domain-containing protein [Gemmatimonadota bacterium]
MKKNWGYPFIALISVVALCCYANVNAQEEYEDFLESEGETSDQSELLERLAELKEHPIDLNAASAPELQRIPYLSPVQAQEIVKHRRAFGPFRCLSDLQGISGVDEDLLEAIEPFVRLKAERSLPAVSGRLRTRILHGASSEEIEGDQFLFQEKVYTRGEASISDRITICVVTEKDADEKSLSDHRVSSLEIERWHVFDRIIFGNFRLDFGQGLVLGAYSGGFKGASFPSSLKKRERGVGANTSTSETGPFFGLGCSGSVRGITFSLFGSQARVDATFNSDSTVSSVYESGLHRTETEQRKRDTLKEDLYGAHFSYEGGSWGNVGVCLYHSGYDHVFDPKDTERKRFTFRGGSNTVAGINFDLYCRRLNLFGEISRTEGSGSGMVMGLIIDFDRIEIDALVRNYEPHFYNRHNYAFAEKPDETQNECGALLGFVYQPDSGTRLRAYVDRLRNPWRHYYEKMPPTRQEFWTQAERRVAGGMLATVRLRLKNKETNKSVGEGQSKNTGRQQVNVRGQVDWEFSEAGRLRGRWESVRVGYPDLSVTETGWLLSGDLRLCPKKWMTLDTRIVLFETDSYDSRIYEFENDLPGLMTNSGFYGEGMRWYVLAKVKLGRAARMAFKYSMTRFYEGDREDDRRFGIQFECNPVF